MGKVNLLVKYCLINNKNEYNIKGILIDSKLKFIEQDNKMILDLKNDILKRITLNEEIIFDFRNGICFIKATEGKINFKIFVEKLEKNNKYFYVKYKIDMNDYFEISINIID